MSTVILIFTGSFSVYSYIADYLRFAFELTGLQVSYMLMLFGTAGVLGNWIAGIALKTSIYKTIISYLLIMIFLFYTFRYLNISVLTQVFSICLWGFFHMAGFLICQVWISSSASEAPELANSIVVSTANLGIALGALLGGEIILRFGLQHIIWGGIAAFLLAIVIVWGSHRFRQNDGK